MIEIPFSARGAASYSWYKNSNAYCISRIFSSVCAFFSGLGSCYKVKIEEVRYHSIRLKHLQPHFVSDFRCLDQSSAAFAPPIERLREERRSSLDKKNTLLKAPTREPGNLAPKRPAGTGTTRSTTASTTATSVTDTDTTTGASTPDNATAFMEKITTCFFSYQTQIADYSKALAAFKNDATLIVDNHNDGSISRETEKLWDCLTKQLVADFNVDEDSINYPFRMRTVFLSDYKLTLKQDAKKFLRILDYIGGKITKSYMDNGNNIYTKAYNEIMSNKHIKDHLKPTSLSEKRYMLSNVWQDELDHLSDLLKLTEKNNNIHDC